MIDDTTKNRDWKTIPFTDCLEKVSFGGAKQVKLKDYSKTGDFPIVDQGQSFIAGYTDDKSKVIDGIQPFIIFGDHTRILKYIDFPIVLGADGTKVIKPKKDFNTSFFYYYLKNLDIPNRGYNRHYSILKEKTIAKPELPEQKAIARVLNTAQEAITGQEELIEKLKKLKKSIMQHLFTHGTKNEPTKITEIGEVPKSWEVVKLGKVVNFRTGKLNANAMEDNGIYPFFTCSQDNFKINTFAFDCEALLLSGNNARAVYSVKHYQGKFNAYQRTYVITLKNSNDNYIFMKYILEMNLENLKSLSIGSSTKYLTLGMLQNLQISRPRQTEQSKIGNAMESIDQKIESAQTKLSAYQKLFKTLLHELMSGERRIG